MSYGYDLVRNNDSKSIPTRNSPAMAVVHGTALSVLGTRIPQAGNGYMSTLFNCNLIRILSTASNSDSSTTKGYQRNRSSTDTSPTLNSKYTVKTGQKDNNVHKEVKHSFRLLFCSRRKTCRAALPRSAACFCGGKLPDRRFHQIPSWTRSYHCKNVKNETRKQKQKKN